MQSPNSWINWAFSFLTAMVVIPLAYSVGPKIESYFFPVVENVNVISTGVTPRGLKIMLTYDKVRDCEWFGVTWQRGPVRYVVDFMDERFLVPRSRPVGSHQVGPWLLIGAPGLEGSTAHIWHRCHGLWLTHDVLYPPLGKD